MSARLHLTYVSPIIRCVAFPSQRIRSTVDEKEQKQLLMDLDVVMRSSDCPYIVQFYGALFREVTHVSAAHSQTDFVPFVSNVWIFCVSGRLLDLYGTYGYLVRQILQICILLVRRRDSRRNIRENNISCKFKLSRFSKIKRLILRLPLLNLSLCFADCEGT